MAEEISANTEVLMERDKRILALEVEIAKLKEENENREKGCERCANGKVNTFGAEIFKSLECEREMAVYHEKPYIIKTNGMYFLIVDNFTPIRIYACPNCSRKLEG